MSSNKPERKSSRKVRVSDLIRILKASEDFIRSISQGEKDSILIMKDFRTILKPYEKLDAANFLETLKQLLKDRESVKLSTMFTETDIKRVPLEELKKLVSTEDLETKDLLFIAEKRLEIPIGVLKKMKKELIKQKILTTIQNIEKLDTIQTMASK